jgi:hypothetical protein
MNAKKKGNGFIAQSSVENLKACVFSACLSEWLQI